MQANITVRSVDEIPDYLRRLKEARFYGQVHFTLRAGNVCRLVTEQSQVFDEPKGGTHDRNNR